LQDLKPYFALLVNQFNVNVVVDGCPICQSFVTNLYASEMKLTEMQKDLALKNFSHCRSTDEFWRQIPEIEYPKLIRPV